jgi:hypothetical protein
MTLVAFSTTGYVGRILYAENLNWCTAAAVVARFTNETFLKQWDISLAASDVSVS